MANGMGFFGQEFAPELASAGFQNFTASIEPRAAEERLRVGQALATRGASGIQEADILAQGERARTGALLGAAQRSDFARQGAIREERLIDENRRYNYQVHNEDVARQEQARKQAMIGSILGAIFQPIGSVLGSAKGAKSQQQGFDAQNALLSSVLQMLVAPGQSGQGQFGQSPMTLQDLLRLLPALSVPQGANAEGL